MKNAFQTQSQTAPNNFRKEKGCEQYLYKKLESSTNYLNDIL